MFIILSKNLQTTSQQHRKSFPNNPLLQNKTKNTNMQYLVLPYMSEQLTRKVYYILRTHGMLDNTRVVFTAGTKLNDLLSRSNLQPTACNKMNDNKCYQCSETCMMKNVCYELKCNMCQKSYIGETGRHMRNRTWEHYKSARDKTTTTSMGKHYNLVHPHITVPEQPFTAKVRRHCKDFVERQIWQSVLIKYENPSINVQLADNHLDGEWKKRTWQIK